MSGSSYPDRDEWPRYWQTIRFAVASLVAGALVVAGATFLPQPQSPGLRIVMAVLIGGAAVFVVTRAARRFNEWWEARST